MRTSFTLSLAAALIAAPVTADDHGAAPMTAEDLITMPRLGSPTVSPDGRHAVYPVTHTDPESYARSGTLYWIDLADPNAGSSMIDLGGDASSASFGADGYLYFLSSRAADGAEADSYNRLWRTSIGAGGTAETPSLVADFHGTSIDGFELSPDASKLAVWAPIARDCPKFGCAGDGTAHLPGPGTGRLYDGSDGFVRHWDHWTSPGTVNRVFVFNIENGSVIGGGVPVDGADPTSGITGHTPTMPFGGEEDIAWAPDGSGLYFAARIADAYEPQSTDLDIYWSDLSGSAPVDLTKANEAHDSIPAPSPDGKWLAYVAMERPTYESDQLVIQLRNVRTGETRALTEAFDRSFSSIAWTPDSRWIIATAGDVLDTPAFKIDPRTGAVEKLDLMAGNEAHIANVKPLSGERLLFTRDSIGGPPELYLSTNWDQAMPVTNVAVRRMGQMASTVTTRFNFPGANGDTVWGQITRLEGQQGPIPAILYIHGGPQGSFNDGWSSRWNPRVLASQGYAVISVDFHGSTGYGQAFTDSINQDWGGKPLEDLQLGLAAALELDPQIDGSNACAMGASYGGYMVNWIAGKWPDRFKCLIQHDGVFDARAMAYETEELWFDIWEHGGKKYYEDPDAYEKWNPVNHVDKWQTPMLVITGEKDFRIPYTQGVASFTALQIRHIPSQLLVFPDENHWVLGAKNSLQWHQTVFAWLERWLKPDSASE